MLSLSWVVDVPGGCWTFGERRESEFCTSKDIVGVTWHGHLVKISVPLHGNYMYSTSKYIRNTYLSHELSFMIRFGIGLADY